MGFSSIKQKTLSVAISLLAGIAGSFFGSDLANRLIIGLAVAAALLVPHRPSWRLLGIDDVAALQKLQSDGLEPQIARAVAYVRDISEIATEAHQQFIEITQAWIGHLKASLDSAVRDASSSASAGSGALFSALESASGVASELYEKVSESSVHAFAAPADGDSKGESVNKTARRSARAARTTAAGSEAGEAVISDGEN